MDSNGTPDFRIGIREEIGKDDAIIADRTKLPVSSSAGWSTSLWLYLRNEGRREGFPGKKKKRRPFFTIIPPARPCKGRLVNSVLPVSHTRLISSFISMKVQSYKYGVSNPFPCNSGSNLTSHSLIYFQATSLPGDLYPIFESQTRHRFQRTPNPRNDPLIGHLVVLRASMKRRTCVSKTPDFDICGTYHKNSDLRICPEASLHQSLSGAGTSLAYHSIYWEQKYGSGGFPGDEESCIVPPPGNCTDSPLQTRPYEFMAHSTRNLRALTYYSQACRTCSVKVQRFLDQQASIYDYVLL